MKPHPFVTWVGGKSRMLKRLLPFFPQHIKNYHEPFVGGGSVFLELRRRHESSKFSISDLNGDLMNCYRCIQEDSKQVIKELNMVEYQKIYHHESFFETMKNEYKPTCPFKQAARYIYLTRKCFGGIVKNKGKRGRDYTDNFFQPQNITYWGNILQGTEIKRQNYFMIQPEEGDFVYLDPPYYNTGNELYKDSEGLTSLDWQKNLAGFCHDLHNKGVQFMLSNSWNGNIIDLYRKFRIIKVMSTHRMQMISGKKTNGFELLVKNY